MYYHIQNPLIQIFFEFQKMSQYWLDSLCIIKKILLVWQTEIYTDVI